MIMLEMEGVIGMTLMIEGKVGEAEILIGMEAGTIHTDIPRLVGW